MSITILENPTLRIKINTFGAEMQSFFDKKKGIECLWQGNSDYWARQAPVLFPIVGRLVGDTLKSASKNYPMTQHGFARDMNFELYQKTEDRVQFRLTANQETKKHYPFDFELLITYQLKANRLITSYLIRNPQQSPLPASIGAHPAFNWPLSPKLSKEDHLIVFDQTESHDIRQLQNGLMLKTGFPSPIKGNELKLKDSLFIHDALIFDQLKSRQLTYQAGRDLSISLTFNDFPHLGIWTKPGAPFICLEPWQGHSSPLDFDGDFSQKPGGVLIDGHSEIKKIFDIQLN